MKTTRRKLSVDHETDSVSKPVRSWTSGGAWTIVVVISCHLIPALIGISLQSGNIFYLSWRNEFKSNSGETAAVQSVSSAMANIGGLIGGVLVKRYSCRCVGMIGVTLTCLGLFCSFFVVDIFQLYITAFIMGTGAGIGFNVVLVAIVVYFKKGYKIANGIASSGIGTGSLVVPPMVVHLTERYGWRGSILISSAIMANAFALFAVFRTPRRFSKLNKTKSSSVGDDTEAGLQLKNLIQDTLGDNSKVCDEYDSLEEGRRVRDQPVLGSHDDTDSVHSISHKSFQTSTRLVLALQKLASILGLTVFLRSYRFALLCLFAIQFGFVYYGPVVFFIPRAQDIGTTPSVAALLLSIYGTGNCLGRLVNGFLISWRLSAECVGSISLVVACGSLLTMNLDGCGFLMASSFLFGFSTGVMVGITVILTRQYVGVVQFSVCTGLYQTGIGIGAFLGPVISGWLYDASQSYRLIFYVCAGIYLICAVQVILMPKLKRLEPGMNLGPSER